MHETHAFTCLATAAVLLLLRARRLRPRFARMATELTATTRAALERHRWLPLRHAIVHDAVPAEKLAAAFEPIREAFRPHQVDYSNAAYGKDHWNLSCFMEYTNGVATKQLDLSAAEPMRAACAGILADCDACFLAWYDKMHPRPRDATRTLIRMQSFVTRYRPNPDETHLPRHIDGANVDGSLVLGLPTYSAFGDSGGLTVWDGENDAEGFRYPVAAGDACLLDSRVWHQSNPISHGERWVLVVFYEVKTMRNGEDAVPRGRVVRELLARRVKECVNRSRTHACTSLPYPRG